jgi:hypothetical protein
LKQSKIINIKRQYEQNENFNIFMRTKSHELNKSIEENEFEL